ncbi:MAG: polyprenyl synthetase family protein [Flavobacteriales bacterium]
MKELTNRIKTIESHLSTLDFPTQPNNLYDPIRYFIALGGKRVRPLFTVACGELFSVPESESMPAASAIELFHNFSLIHDDIMDKAPLRRGLATVHEKWNAPIAILSGDVLLVHAYEQLEHYAPEKSYPLFSLLNKTAKEVCMGQQMDMDFEHRNDVTEEAYLEMIRLKTSVLLGCACAFGGILGEAKPEDLKALYGLGEALGMAFQITDDILDAFGDAKTFGKQVGGDILSDKKTLLYVALQKLANEEQRLMVEKLREASPTEKIEGMKVLFEQSGALAYCQKLSDHYDEKARINLQILLQKYSGETLEQLADYLTNRTN